ncbi:BTAD domain-containing putative transcriptional regulator [Microtetraspora niveoalba]|uniref:BTAD domain-containing putative transcriptional regulator n=1 Tax=Microtetraspora niveoalba TaxID=46175 RepID=UPI00082DB145|nr:BTAD domain-containing putative transcriptional regulator [Microtetraspora niveoalba]
MRFGVLGPLTVWRADGETVTVPGLKVRALLADLLAHEGRPVPADRLVDDLWGDDPPSNPLGALSAKVSQLRRVLEDAEPGGRELVPLQPAGYLLKADADADDFRSLLAEAGRADDPRSRAALLSDALALWRGPAFADFADEPFVRAAAAHLTELRLTAHEDLAEVRLALGEHAPLAGELAHLVAEHPLRERLRAVHMRALYRSGRQSEALAGYESLRTLLADELGLDPGADLVALHQAILTQDPALAAAAPGSPARRPVTNLPAPVTGLIGREDAVAEIRARLGTDRLVTLTGPGGVGKTRLALEAARCLFEHDTDTSPESPAPDAFPDGVWWVELAALDRPDDQDALSRLAETIMGVLDVRDGAASEQPAEPVTAVERLADALRPRRLLLVLDNCEHVVEPASALAERLLRAAPGLRLLATGQEPLGLAGEVVWSVPPLEVPGHAADDIAVLERAGSVRLFVARASASARGFALDASNASAVAMLCRRLDGIPLALELAATRVRALGVHGLVERLDDRFRLLATGHRGAPPRQQTLAAMIGWSWDLLTDPERVVLRRLAVHADGCTLEAAEAVCAEDGLDVLDLLARLVDRSLVMIADGPDGPRYRLLESVAAYCVERLQEAEELDRIRRRHHRFHIAFAERAVPHLHGPDQRRWLRRLDAEAANLRAALNAAVRDGDADDALRLVNAMAWYWFLRGRLAEARRSFAAALAVAAADGDVASARQAEALAWSVGIGLIQGEAAGREDRRREALLRYENAGDPGGLARARWFLAYTAIDLGDLAVAGELLDLALPVFRSRGDRWGTAAALATRAKLAHVRGDLDALRRDGELSLALFEELGDRWGGLEATGWLGALAEMTGDLDGAELLHRDGLRLAEELELWTEVGGRLAWLGWTALRRGDFAGAGDLCARALRLADEHCHQAGQIFAKLGLACAARQEGRLLLAETHLRDLLDRAPRRDAGQAVPPYLPLVLTELGFVAEQRADARTAFDLHLEAFQLAAGFDTSRDLTIAVDGIAGALSLAGHHERAARVLGAAAAIRACGSLSPAPAEHMDIERITRRVRAALGEERFAVEAGHGAALAPGGVRSLLAPPDA